MIIDRAWFTVAQNPKDNGASILHNCSLPIEQELEVGWLG